jgi:hypothetical protein
LPWEVHFTTEAGGIVDCLILIVDCFGSHFSFGTCGYDEAQIGVETRMIERGPATEDEMISAFLRAEIDSSRYGGIIKGALARLGLGASLIDAPNLADAVENGRRRLLLGYRGYACREDLFTGFPFDVIWRRVDLEAGDFQTMQYMKDTVTNHPNWTNLSNGTRLVSVGASNLHKLPSNAAFQQIAVIARAIRDGVRFHPLIAAQHHQGNLVLIEGHSRATAYALERFSGLVGAFVGSSPSMNKWVFY